MRISYKFFKELVDKVGEATISDRCIFDIQISENAVFLNVEIYRPEISALEKLLEKQEQARKDNEGQGDNKTQ